MLLSDLHIHTNYSKDGESSVREVIARAESIGLDVIAITDHDTVEGALEACSIKTEVLVIPGIEVSTKQGHLIVLGVKEPIQKGLDVFETIAIARKLNALVIVPHPFHMYRHGIGIKNPDVLRNVDAIEVFNSRYIVGSANLKAKRHAKRLGKPQVGGSDAHNAKFVGFGRTMIDSEKDVKSVLNSIREGKTRPLGKKTPIRIYTHQSLKNSWRKIKHRIQ